MSETLTETKLCPFRMFYREWAGFVPDKPIEEGYPAHADEFAPCLQDKCAMWRGLSNEMYEIEWERALDYINKGKLYDLPFPAPGHCGLAGKP